MKILRIFFCIDGAVIFSTNNIKIFDFNRNNKIFAGVKNNFIKNI